MAACACFNMCHNGKTPQKKKLNTGLYDFPSLVIMIKRIIAEVWSEDICFQEAKLWENIKNSIWLKFQTGFQLWKT